MFDQYSKWFAELKRLAPENSDVATKSEGSPVITADLYRKLQDYTDTGRFEWTDLVGLYFCGLLAIFASKVVTRGPSTNIGTNVFSRFVFVANMVSAFPPKNCAAPIVDDAFVQREADFLARARLHAGSSTL